LMFSGYFNIAGGISLNQMPLPSKTGFFDNRLTVMYERSIGMVYLCPSALYKLGKKNIIAKT